MRKLLGIATLGILLESCKVKNTVPGLIEFQCREGKSFWIDYGKDYAMGKPLPDSAIFHFGDQALRLPRAGAESGVRYSDGLTTYTNRNDVATLATRQGAYEACKAVQ
jgi:membrane-bound inhibitor of C-type lysozyme